MYSFIICLLALIASYFVYGKIVERTVGVDETKETPAYRLHDGVDYMPMSRIRAFLVHFLNIAGLGPIFGAIQVHYLVRQHFYGLHWVQSSLEEFMISSQGSCPFEMMG